MLDLVSYPASSRVTADGDNYTRFHWKKEETKKKRKKNQKQR